MFTLKVNGQTYSNVIGFEFVPRHGFSTIKKTMSGAIQYEGFYKDNYFKVESVYDYGVTSWEVLHGDIGDEDSLFDWIQDGNSHAEDKVYKNWIESIQ